MDRIAVGLVIGIGVGALFLLVITKLLSKYIFKKINVAAAPIRALFQPIKRSFLSIFDAFDFMVAKMSLPSYVNSVFGGWKLSLFMILALVFVVIRTLIAIPTMGASVFAEQMMMNTTIGAINELFNFKSIDFHALVRIVIIAVATDIFVEKCKHLPFSIQIIYDVIFLLFCIMLSDLIQLDFIGNLPEKWWNILQIKEVNNLDVSASGGIFKQSVMITLVIWGNMLNFLLRVIVLVFGVIFLIKAIDDVISSMLCAIVSVGLFGGISLFFEGLEIQMQIPEFLQLFLLVIWIIATELLLLNIDEWLGLEYVDEGDETEFVKNSECPYDWVSLFFGGYFGSPMFYFGLLLCFGIGSTRIGEWLLVEFLILLSFGICCVPGMWKIWHKSSSVGDKLQHSLFFVAKTIIYIPHMAIGILDMLIGLISELSGRDWNYNVAKKMYAWYFKMEW